MVIPVHILQLSVFRKPHLELEHQRRNADAHADHGHGLARTLVPALAPGHVQLLHGLGAAAALAVGCRRVRLAGHPARRLEGIWVREVGWVAVRRPCGHGHYGLEGMLVGLVEKGCTRLFSYLSRNEVAVYGAAAWRNLT